MKNENQIDLVEEVLKRAYSENEVIPEISSEWQNSLMSTLKDEFIYDQSASEKLEKSFLFYSWVAAAVAASLIIVSVIIFSKESNNIEDDLQQLYSDNTLDSITMEIASASTY